MRLHWVFLSTWCLCNWDSTSVAERPLGVGQGSESGKTTAIDDGAGFRVLAIGISRYKELPALEFTASDASQLVQAYAEVGGVEKTRLTLIVDDQDDSDLLVEKTVDEEISRFLDSCQRDDTAVLFFSGHGVQLKSGFALAASDFSLEYGDYGAISIDRLRTALSHCSAARKVVVLDCCFSGAFGAASRDLTTPLRSIPGCVVLAASRPSEESLETQQLKAGVFTHWLVRGLRGAANVKIDGVIDAAELFDFVSLGVPSNTAKQQSPAIAFDQSTEIPAIIELKTPDRPSDNVGVIAFSLPPSPRTMSIVLDSVGRFPDRNARRTIGVCHWVLRHAESESVPSVKAKELIARIDAKILAGEVSLGPIEKDEEPIRRRVPAAGAADNEW